MAGCLHQWMKIEENRFLCVYLSRSISSRLYHYDFLKLASSVGRHTLFYAKLGNNLSESTIDKINFITLNPFYCLMDFSLSFTRLSLLSLDHFAILLY